MRNPSGSSLRRFLFRSALSAFALVSLSSVAPAQVTAHRLQGVPSLSAERLPLTAGPSARVLSAERLGSLPGETALTNLKLYLKPTAAQQADLEHLLVAQQTPGSPEYHQWLTPAQYGARFGVGDADIAVLTAWLQARGFSVDEVAPSRNFISFSGPSSAVENAFSTSMGRFRRDGQDFYENSTAVTIPAALSDVVGGVTGLTSYHLSPHSRVAQQVSPDYTASTTSHYLVPWDLRQIYGVNTLLSQGLNGAGINIAILGQSAVNMQQLTLFQQKTGQIPTTQTTATNIVPVVVPGTGVSNYIAGDEGESELDLEYAGGVAPGAKLLFIYTGCTNAVNSSQLKSQASCNNNGVFDSITYAVINDLAPILSLSYGGCEASLRDFATSTVGGNTPFEAVMQQASTQGQTIAISSGDQGATSCETSSGTKVATGGLSVSYPASSAYATAVGGTTLNSDSSTYWSSSNNSFAGSAIGYVPEVAWNDTANYHGGVLSSSGGGASAIFSKPSWQSGPGVPADSHRDVPDIAFPANVTEHAYLVCSDGATCTTNTGSFTDGGAVGGTSAATPVFAGMLAVIEQANGGNAQGNLNPTLYSLAAGSSAGSIFHDITSGNNIVPCQGGTTGCSATVSTATGTMGFSAGAGYDLVTGLGSVSATGLQAALAAIPTTGPLTPTVSVTPATTTPTGGSTDLLTIAVTGKGSTPAGTVNITVDGTAVNTATLSNGGATYTYAVPVCASSVACVHTVIALYKSSDSRFTAGSAVINLTVAATAPATSFTLSAGTQSVAVKSGSQATNIITVTPANGFTGSVTFTAQIVQASGSFNGCYGLPTATVAGGAVTSTMTIYTSTSGCTSSTLRAAHLQASSRNPLSSGSRTTLAALAAGLLLCCGMRRKMRAGALLAIGGIALTLGVTGCGNGGTPVSSATSTTSTGNYVIQVTGTSGSVSGSTTFTLVVQ